MNPIGVGIIGSGSWGRKVAAAYLNAERKGRLKLLKVYDNSIASLGTLLMDHETASIGESRLSIDVQDILRSNDISAVHIATPSQTHATFAKMALEAGKNVLIENPIALNTIECRELFDLAGRRGLVFEQDNYVRFDRSVQAASDMIRKGDLGQVLYAGVQWTDAARPCDRDVLFELGHAPIEILNVLLGTWPNELSGIAGAYTKCTHNDLVHVFAQYPDETFAVIELNGLHPRKLREILVVGSSATLNVDCSNQRVVEYSGGKKIEVPVVPSNVIDCEVDRFIDRIVHGELGADALSIKTVEILEEIQASLWTKVPSITQFGRGKNATLSEAPCLETAVGLLEIVHKGANKTPIENEGEINPDLVRRYFVMLEKIGLVDSWELSNQEKTYSLTTKGLQFLVDYYESQRLGEITDNTRRVLQAVGLGTI